MLYILSAHTQTHCGTEEEGRAGILTAARRLARRRVDAYG